MAGVNSVTKTDQMKTCQDFAESFLAIICNMAANYDEVRLVFDRYMKTSLKEDEDKEDQRKVNILPCEGHHFNPEYFPDRLSLRYPDQSRAHRAFG